VAGPHYSKERRKETVKTEKQILDTIYHNLRLANVSAASDGGSEMLRALRGIAVHLTSSPGNYAELLEFSEYYGSTYLSPHVNKLASKKFEDIECVVELGAGTGWFGELLSYELDADYARTDKRVTTGIREVVNVETEEGLNKIKRLKDTTLVVMCDLLHCVEPKWRGKLYEILKNQNFIIAEYSPNQQDELDSYNRQIGLKGCYPFSHSEISIWIPNINKVRYGKYVVMYRKKEKI
jgi:hypothetical protein